MLCRDSCLCFDSMFVWDSVEVERIGGVSASNLDFPKIPKSCHDMSGASSIKARKRSLATMYFDSGDSPPAGLDIQICL